MNISRTYTFADGVGLINSRIETEVKNIVDFWNNHNQGILTWSYLKATNDITVSTAGKGLVVKTPDGTHTYRIAIDNLGSITTELVS